MLSSIVQIIAAGVVLLAFAALIRGATSQNDSTRKTMLRIFQVCMALAGLMLIALSVSGVGWDHAVYGFMLIVFGTGISAIGGRTKGGKT